MKVEEVTAFVFRYAPWDRTFPIRSCELTIIAKTREEAEIIALKFGHQFFEQDCTCTVTEFGGGYRQVLEDEK